MSAGAVGARAPARYGPQQEGSGWPVPHGHVAADSGGAGVGSVVTASVYQGAPFSAT